MEMLESTGRAVVVKNAVKQETYTPGTCLYGGNKNIPTSIEDILENLLNRSVCMVKVAALIVDTYGCTVSTGWNSSGPDGFGEHAERAAIRRANRDRLNGSTIYVAGEWRGRDKATPSKPCLKCQRVIDKWGLRVIYRDSDGGWK